jgi:hypothetical protein
VAPKAVEAVKATVIMERVISLAVYKEEMMGR